MPSASSSGAWFTSGVAVDALPDAKLKLNSSSPAVPVSMTVATSMVSPRVGVKTTSI